MKTTLHYYYFNLHNQEEKENYLTLCAELKSKGMKRETFISGMVVKNPSEWYAKKIAPLDNTVIELETAYIFDNQWNTASTKTSETGLRLFDWQEEIYPNKDIKEGQWLEQTAEMIEIRENTHKCQYCGKNYYKPEQVFCSSCIGSEYLTEDTLYMLQLKPVKGSFSAVPVPAAMIETYQIEHAKTLTAKLEKRQAAKLEQIKKDIASSKKEYKAFQWLIKNNIDFENCIYYTHTDVFSFGWRNKLTHEEKDNLTTKLGKFPYKYELK